MLSKVKAGIIGLDDLGKAYATLLSDHLKGIDLLAASARKQVALLYAKNDLSLQYVYSDDTRLIENHDLDAVFILAPHGQRSMLASQAIQAGKHVFIAPPLATNVEDAHLFYKIASSRPSQVTMSGFAHRLNPVLIEAVRMIHSGDIGDVVSVEASSSFTLGLYSKYGRESGSLFIDRALNEIDLALWIVNDEIRRTRCIENEGVVHAQSQFKNGVVFHLAITRERTVRESNLVIRGKNGTISLSNMQPRMISIREGKSGIESKIIADTDFLLNNDYLHLKHFTDVLQGKQRNQLKLSANLRALEVAIAMEKSNVLHREVSIPEEGTA